MTILARSASLRLDFANTDASYSVRGWRRRSEPPSMRITVSSPAPRSALAPSPLPSVRSTGALSSSSGTG